MNFASWVILGIVVVVVVLAARATFSKKGRASGGCSGCQGCQGCQGRPSGEVRLGHEGGPNARANDITGDNRPAPTRLMDEEKSGAEAARL